MINQVDFESYLTRAWEYREQRYMRLANHRPAGGQRPACPPQVQRGGASVADGFLAPIPC